MERSAQKKPAKPKTKAQKEIDRLVEEIDETNIFVAFFSRSKKLLSRPFIEGIFYGIGGAITALAVAKYFKGCAPISSSS